MGKGAAADAAPSFKKGVRMKYNLYSSGNTQLHLTAIRKSETPGAVRIWNRDRLWTEFYFKYDSYETCFLPLEQNTDYIIELDRIHISLAYWYDPENVLEQGVTFLEFGDEIHFYSKDTMADAMNQPYRNQIHFSPYKNWMNDPNGLCWFQGYYHVFYQYNPNSQVWGNMHWGHAVSKDLIHWKHLPVAIYPQIELAGCTGYRGGAFSGCAVIENDQMQLFYTRHFGRTDRSWQRQWQVTRHSRDGVTFSHEEICIWGTPEGVLYDFRDPKVTRIQEQWVMVLGGSCHGRPSVFQYISSDLKNWNYRGILYQEQNPIYGIAECPDFFPLDGMYVLITGYIYADKTNQESRDTRYYIGTYEDNQFHPVSEGLFDHGKDIYAAQTFEKDGRRICFGWNCPPAEGHIETPDGSNGTLSLPRELNIRENRLVSLPCHEIQDLFTEMVQPGPYYLKLTRDLSSPESEVLLAKGDGSKLGLRVTDSNIEICLLCPEKSSDTISFTCRFSTVRPIETIDIYMDRAMLELYVNEGELSCSRRFYMKNPILQPEIIRSSCRTMNLKRIRSIWERP